MRALSYENYGGIDVMRIGDLPVPKIADDEALIRVITASVNPFDWKLRNGDLQKFFEPEFPIVPGRNGCGEIVSLGHNASGIGLEIGQRVGFLSSRMQYGALAEYVAVKAQNFIAPVPETLSDEQCAAIPMVGLSAWNAMVETAEITSGMKVLVQGGSGGVGSIAIQIANYLGAEVFATCHSRNVLMVEGFGATAIAYDANDFVDEVSGCDIVFDTVGGEVHEKSYEVLKDDGRLVYLVAAPFNDVSEKYSVKTIRVNVMEKVDDLRKVIDLAADGILTANVSATLPLADFKTVFQSIESGKSGKIVLAI